MTGPWLAMVGLGVRALRRSGMWWGVGIVAFVVLNLAFWPSLEGTDALSSLEGMSEGLLEAFGAQNIAAPAGYLDGQVYALMLPLLLSGMAIAGVTALTSGDEHAGRLELVHALPVSRRSVWLARLTASLAVLSLVAAVTAAAVALSLRPFSLDEVGAPRVVAATMACALLAAFHAVVAYTLGAFGLSRGTAVGGAVLVLVAGYLANFVFPIADALSGGRTLSPWHWAIGEQPVSDGVRFGWLLLLVAVGIILTAVGTLAVDRRDIRSA